MQDNDRIDLLTGRLARLKKDAANYTQALMQYPRYLASAIEKDDTHPLQRNDLDGLMADYREMLDKAQSTVSAYWQTETELRKEQGK